MNKATQLSEISLTCMPKPLDDETWDQFYIQTGKVRGGNKVEKLIKDLKNVQPSPDPVKCIFTGHQGSGKSTELHRLKKELDNEYEIITGEIGKKYNLPGLDYLQILYYCSVLLINLASEKNIRLDKDEAENLLDWFDDEYKEEYKKEDHQIEVEGGAKIGWFQSIFASFSGKVSSGGGTLEKVVKHIEENLDQLTTIMASIIRAINKTQSKRLLIILEDLDKLESLSKAREIFFKHKLQLLQIPCSVIYTFPIALWYDSDPALQNYPIRSILPMIQIGPGPGKSDAKEKAKVKEGRKSLKQIVFHRIDKGLIQEGALELLIDKSGGHIRDLLYLIRQAALNAQVDGNESVALADAEDAVLQLQSEYSNRIAPPQESVANIDLQDIETVLKLKWPLRGPDQSEAFKHLLQNLCILEYNGDKWYDLHPLVRDYLKVKNAESKKTKKPTASKKIKTVRKKK